MADPQPATFTGPDRPDRVAAVAIVRRLKTAGHEAYLVGGCVRDALLAREPKEFDVATSARPEQVEGLFRRTIEVGKAFGVVRVIDGDIVTEVATFRSDDAYIDGRRPTGVRFTTVREDAERRDFTVNALFLDPDTGEILDFAGGRADLAARTLRAIGDPRKRFEEDKLRLLRAVRFAASGPFEIEPATWAAVCAMADSITVVSAERIREELSRILTSGRSAHGMRLLDESGLLRAILPEIDTLHGVAQPPEFHPEGDVWIHTMLALEAFDREGPHDLVLGLSVLLHDVGKPATYRIEGRIRFDGHARKGAEMADAILRRLRFSNDVIDAVVPLVDRHMAFTDMEKWREAKQRRFLTDALAERQLQLLRCDLLGAFRPLDRYTWAASRRAAFLAEPPKTPPVVNGRDLMAAGYPAGPALGRLLEALEDERLEGRLASRDEAMRWVTSAYPPPLGDPGRPQPGTSGACCEETHS